MTPPRLSDTPPLHLEGSLVATAEMVDTYRHDRDEWHNLSVFRAEDGYTLVTLARYESYSDTGAVERGVLDITVDQPGDICQLEELVSGRHRVTSEAWWQILDAGRHYDPDLHAAWVPEQMRRNLDRASLHDHDLAVASSFFNGRALPAPGRSVDGGQRAALEAMANHLEELGWRVQPDRPLVAQTADRGGILSEGTEILGALRAGRYGWEGPILVRVDDCGEIYARLAEPGDVPNAKLRMVEGPNAFEMSRPRHRRSMGTSPTRCFLRDRRAGRRADEPARDQRGPGARLMGIVAPAERIHSMPEVVGTSLRVSTLDRRPSTRTSHPGLRIRRHRDLLEVDELVAGLRWAARGGGPG
jgi:hypothetical protein